VCLSSINKQKLLQEMDDKKAEFQQAVERQEKELQEKLEAHRCALQEVIHCIHAVSSQL
jgi:hypothetical protein